MKPLKMLFSILILIAEPTLACAPYGLDEEVKAGYVFQLFKVLKVETRNGATYMEVKKQRDGYNGEIVADTIGIRGLYDLSKNMGLPDSVLVTGYQPKCHNNKYYVSNLSDVYIIRKGIVYGTIRDGDNGETIEKEKYTVIKNRLSNYLGKGRKHKSPCGD